MAHSARGALLAELLNGPRLSPVLIGPAIARILDSRRLCKCCVVIQVPMLGTLDEDGLKPTVALVR